RESKPGRGPVPPGMDHPPRGRPVEGAVHFDDRKVTGVPGEVIRGVHPPGIEHSIPLRIAPPTAANQNGVRRTGHSSILGVAHLEVNAPKALGHRRRGKTRRRPEILYGAAWWLH